MFPAYTITYDDYGNATYGGGVSPDSTAYADMVAASNTASLNSLPNPPAPTLNPFTGTIGKVFDTSLDAFGAALGQVGAAKLVGSAYPTGQQSPSQVLAQQQAQQTAVTAASSNTTKMILIGGGVVLAVILAAALIPRR